ncbi:MAG: hypothetical protein LBK13_05310, partial [Spirochaetales bacterium]|nr:hypothetical protein [Spirochaetales bacterium]
MLKKICLCVALFMSLVYAAAALDTGTREAAPVPASLADIDAEGLKLAALIGQRLSALAGSAPQPPRIRIDEFPDNGSRSILGRLWAQNLMGGLANLANRGFTLTLDPAPSSCDFILSGEIIEAGPTIRIITRLVKTKEHELAAIWNTDFQKTPFMRELLGPAAEMVPSESRRAA